MASQNSHLTLPDGNHIWFGDNLDVLATIPDASVDLVYIDPPFNTGKKQSRKTLRTRSDDTGDRTGFGGKRYTTSVTGQRSYHDMYEDYLAFLEPRFKETLRILNERGTFYFHIDYREVHYCKVLLDEIFGRDHFLNEIIWAYDYGGRSKRTWPAKHDNILVYVKNPKQYCFNWEEVERIPYMAPGLVSPEKRARGKFPTDTWWHTIVQTCSKDKTGYPTQKPLGVIRRIVTASSPPDGVVMDFFAGSGTVGTACIELNRRFLLVDNNQEAVEVMKHRFAAQPDITWHNALQPVDNPPRCSLGPADNNVCHSGLDPES